MTSKGCVTLKTYDADNLALHHRNKLHFKIYLNRKQLVEIVKAFLELASTKDLSGRLVVVHFKH